MTTTSKRRTVRLNCEAMECRLVPATVLFEGTEAWSGSGGTLTVESKVSEGVSGLPGKRLFEYRVTNVDFRPNSPDPDGIEVFAVPVDDPTTVADLLAPSSGWSVYVGDSGLANSDSAVVWTGSVAEGFFLAPGQWADFSFTTPVTAPLATDATGWAYNADVVHAAGGFCCAPVQGVPSVKFTSGPSKGDNAGEVKFDVRWDNIPAAGVKIIVNVRNYYDNSLLLGAEVIQLNGKMSDKAVEVVVACGTANADKRVVVSLTVVTDDNIPIFPGVSEQKEGRTK